ncbi:MAG: type II toxin-antitoxin system RelE/ParE family toxin [Asticcacaulis sp.]|nr:type II toxin-antitoxin system RelE/ParE family toxin [Asticcacaulis sp.]
MPAALAHGRLRRLWKTCAQECRPTAGYKLTADAEYDFAAIYEYSLGTFGRTQADKYALLLIDAFEFLVASPHAGREFHPRPNTRRLVQESHILYYRAEASGILILRILSQHQDPLRRL